MAFTLTLLGTDTVYVPEAQDYKLVRCINDKLPDLLEEKTLYISEFKEGSFRYTLLNNERKMESGRAYAKGKYRISNLGRALGKVVNALTGQFLLGDKFTEIYIDAPSFKEENLVSYKPAALDIASGKGRAPTIFYPRGETLGFISSKIDQPIPECVVTGPNTLGNNVGTKIIEGLLKLLDAINQDETELNIIAHSRGAVESIVIANILDRLCNIARDSVDNPENKTPFSYESLFNCLTGTSGTQAALTAYVSADTNNKHKINTLLKGIQTKISRVNLNILNIDPVPGDNDNNILLGPIPLMEKSLPGIAWRDSDFFNIPPIVKHYSLCVLENEHSRFFKPIIPKAPDSTKFEFFTLPGNHGTASGSPYDQTQTKRPENPMGEKTYDVQNLMICKIADFLKSHGVVFKDGTESATTEQVTESAVSVAPSAPLSADKAITGSLIPSLEKILSEHLEKQGLEKQKNLFNYYEKIYENWDEYKTFNYTAYFSSLMLNNSAKNALNPTAWLYGVDRQGNRLVHFHQHTDSSLSEHISAPSTRFINTEHALLYMKFKMSDYLWDSRDENPVKQLNKCIKNLQTYSEMAQNTKLMRKRILELTNGKDAQGVSIFQNAFQMILSSIENSYLQNTLSDEDREGIIESFALLYSPTIQTTEDATTLPPSLTSLSRKGNPATDTQEAENWSAFISELKANIKACLERALTSKLEVFEMKLAQLSQTDEQPQQLEHDLEPNRTQALTLMETRIRSITEGIELFLERLRDTNDLLSQKNLTDEFPFSSFIPHVDEFKNKFNTICDFLTRRNLHPVHRVTSSEEQALDGLTSTTITPGTPPEPEQEPVPNNQDLNVEHIDLPHEHLPGSAILTSGILSRVESEPRAEPSEFPLPNGRGSDSFSETMTEATLLNDERANFNELLTNAQQEMCVIEESAQRDRVLANFNEALTTNRHSMLKAQQEMCITEENNQREQVLAGSSESLTKVHQSMLKAQQDILLVAEEKCQRKPILTDEMVHFKQLMIAAMKSQENAQRVVIITEQENSIKRVNFKEKIKLDELSKLCKEYMRYALTILLKHNYQGDGYPTHIDFKRINKTIPTLEEKYNLTKKLYDITMKRSATLKEFTDELKKPEHQTLLKTHRDHLFTRLLAAIWGVLALLPRAVLYSSPKGHINHACFWQSKGEKLNESLKKIILN